MQQNYVPSLFELKHEEPEQCQQSCAGSLLLTWGMLRLASTVSTSDNDHQKNTVGKSIGPVASCRLS